MLYSFDINSYKDGFSNDEYTCIDIPMAGACGVYDFENYYKFCLTLSFHALWNAPEEWLADGRWWDYVGSLTPCLEELNFQQNKIAVHSKEDFLEKVEYNMQKGCPIMILTSYDKLYYHKYYQTEEGKQNHLLLIDSWNTDTKILTIRDSTFLIGQNLVERDINVLFPLNLTEDMVWDIVESSDKSIIVVTQTDDMPVPYLDIMTRGIERAKQFPDPLAMVTKYFEIIERLSGHQMEFMRRRITGSLIGMKMILLRIAEKEELKIDDLISYIDEYIQIRKQIVNKLNKLMMKNEMMSEEDVVHYSGMLSERNKGLIERLTVFTEQISTKKNMTQYPIPIEEFMNNKAFHWDKSLAKCLTDNYLFFEMEKDVIEKQKKRSDVNYELFKPWDVPEFDNISCSGQVLKVKKGVYQRIHILACAEYGNFTESLQVYRGEQKVNDIPWQVSDFYLTPNFGERVFCSGKTYQYKNEAGDVDILPFRSRVLEYELINTEEEMDTIILPNCEHIHIFAITLLSF